MTDVFNTDQGPYGAPHSSDPAATAARYGADATVAALTPFIDDAIALANRWADATSAGQTPTERATTGQLAALVRDNVGLDLAVKFVDRVARPEDNTVAARDLSRISPKQAAGFLNKVDLGLLSLGTVVAPLAPPAVIPLARWRLRQIIGHLVVDSRDPALGAHLAKSREDGFRLNVNLLGEAVLGETEAASRTKRVGDLLARPDIDYVSIKVSSLVSQISTWDTEGTVQRCLERLRPLYRIAANKKPQAFVNLDMEEYRDLDLTIELFTRMLSEPEFHQLEAGIVLQAYLPDALPAMEHLIEFAQRRKANGGAGIKIRLVKGANLAMEKVESALHDWEQAPYRTKEEVDANYLRCLELGLRPETADCVRIGIASHNLFNVALAHLVAESRGTSHALDIEMLQGMAPAQARAVKAVVGNVLLYTPVVAPEDFDVAVSYLIRRLEENATKENFLNALFSDAFAGSLTGGVPVLGEVIAAFPALSGMPGLRSLVGTPTPVPQGVDNPMTEQARRFVDSIAAIPRTGVGPQRSADRPPIGDHFENTIDSDPSLPANRAAAISALAATPPPLTSPILDSTDSVDLAIFSALQAQKTWAAKSAAERADILREAAREMEKRRWELVTVMATEGGKTVDQSDPEISEAIDFARYYGDYAHSVESGPMCDGATFTPSPVILVTPPWNFPVAIPLGGVLAGLAAGSAVIIKPAHPTPGCVEVACEALFAAGVPRDLLQVVRVANRAVGKHLIAHPDIHTVILTGSSETAQMFSSWRTEHPDGDRVYGETSGKNALVVTPAADLDLAVADLVKSAFGHAGQKCSAASLGILVGSVATSERFRRQIVDAVASIRVGWPQDLATTMGPCIEPVDGKLLRALTTLEPGEEWLVKPEKLDDEGRLWTPGLKTGVKPGSFFHLTEVFGPVLGLMEAADLDEAIELQNATAYGLTGGIHSLDEEEIEYWKERVDVGNVYVNRHITGAIVQRQSFGGWKESVVGPGAKAGGPNYVAQMGLWAPSGVPSKVAAPSADVQSLLADLLPLLPDRDDRAWLRAAAGSDAQAFSDEFGVSRDDSNLIVESNIFRYRSLPCVWVRAAADASMRDVLRLVIGAQKCGTEIHLSLDPQFAATLSQLTGSDMGGEASGPASEADIAAAVRRLRRFVNATETSEAFVARAERGIVQGRVRLVGTDPQLIKQLTGEKVTLYTWPVLATGRRELLFFLREQAVSQTMHRFGHLPPHLHGHV